MKLTRPDRYVPKPSHQKDNGIEGMRGRGYRLRVTPGNDSPVLSLPAALKESRLVTNLKIIGSSVESFLQGLCAPTSSIHILSEGVAGAVVLTFFNYGG